MTDLDKINRLRACLVKTAGKLAKLVNADDEELTPDVWSGARDQILDARAVLRETQ